MSFKLQKKVEKQLYNFVDVLDLAICNRCFYLRHKSKKWTNHHQGKLHIEFSKNNNVEEKDVDSWIHDAGHGLLHCFLVAFHAYQETLKTTSHPEILKGIRHGKFEENKFEKLMASCLLHDFVKCTEDYKNHDQRLREYFPDLIPDVYTHSNPPKETPLVIGDRIELRRYEDWEEWSKVDIKKYFNSRLMNIESLKYFYENIRPVLVQLFEGRYELWLRHGAEAKTDFSKLFFPQDFGHEIKRQKMNLCSIETGKLLTFSSQEFPHTNCILDHSQDWSPRGLMRLKTLKSLNNKCIPCRTHSGKDKKLEKGLTKGRDHLCVENLKNTPIENWIFFYHYDFINRHCSAEKVVAHTKGIEEKLALRILNCTEKIIERIKFAI